MVIVKKNVKYLKIHWTTRFPPRSVMTSTVPYGYNKPLPVSQKDALYYSTTLDECRDTRGNVDVRKKHSHGTLREQRQFSTPGGVQQK